MAEVITAAEEILFLGRAPLAHTTTRLELARHVEKKRFQSEAYLVNRGIHTVFLQNFHGSCFEAGRMTPIRFEIETNPSSAAHGGLSLKIHEDLVPDFDTIVAREGHC
jgi:hypothetical protein